MASAKKPALPAAPPASVPEPPPSPAATAVQKIEGLQKEAVQLKRQGSLGQAIAKIGETRQIQAGLATSSDPAAAEVVLDAVMARVERQAR